MKESPQESAEFLAFRRRCRYDVFIQRHLQHVQDLAIVQLADQYGFAITVDDLRRQRRLSKRHRRRKAGRPHRVDGLVVRLMRRLYGGFSLLKLHRPS